MSGTLFALLVIVPAIALPVLLTWWITVKLVPPEPRRVAKWLYPAIVLILSGYVAGKCIAGEIEEGDCICAVCGRTTGLVSLGPIRFETPVSAARGVGSSDLYERAFSQAASPPHQHEWLRVGCFSRGVFLPPMNATMRTCCTMIDSCSWFRDLPQLKDRELARSCAAKLAAASLSEQLRVLHDFDFVAYEQEDPELAFATWRETWRRDHADWP